MARYITIIYNTHTGKEEGRSDPFDEHDDAHEWGKDTCDYDTFFKIRVEGQL